MFQRGDIVSVVFPFSDGSGNKLRPALILSNNSIADSGDVVVLMISSQLRLVDVVVELLPNILSAPMPKNSFVKCHRLFALDAALLERKISSVSATGMKQILEAVMSVIAE